MSASERIPEDIRDDVIRITLYAKGTPSPNLQHLTWLFEVYNTYLNPNPIKCITCRTDRAKVINDLYACVILWKKREKSL